MRLSILLVFLFAVATTTAAQNVDLSRCKTGDEAKLPLPSSLPPGSLNEFEQAVYAFLDGGAYLGWCRDKSVRDTGPYIQNVSYGTHPSVRIYYSPKMMTWLMGGRVGVIPDGAMMIKEQYTPPSARYDDMNEAQLTAAFAKSKDWTIMLKDSKGARDGWFWGEFYPGMVFDGGPTTYTYQNAGFGQYCLRCHASAATESTFASLRNLGDDPVTFFNDNSWRDLAPQEKPIDYTHRQRKLVARTMPQGTNDEFFRYFNSIAPVPRADVAMMVPEPLDRIVAPPVSPHQFVSSDQCMMCHSAATGPYGPTMFLQTAPPVKGVPQGVNVSPYGEWRWSPMGLAGRDPVFFAQLESEIAQLRAEFRDPEPYIKATVNTCLTCHGGMGKRQFDIDHGGPNNDFELSYVNLMDQKDPNFKYGALARDGISCTFCHHSSDTSQKPIAEFLENDITGQFKMGPPEELIGPFKDNEIITTPMNNALGIKPKFSSYATSSRLCGACHAINLPNVDDRLKPGEKESILDKSEKNPAFKPFRHSLEQSTYLEWLNSEFQTEVNPGPNAQSCQDCHMPGSYENSARRLKIDQLQQEFAVIEDSTYPEAEYRAPLADIRVRFRPTGYVRHELLGLNAFLLEIFNQSNDILGVRKDDYMSGSTTDLQSSIGNIVQQAQSKTATVEVVSTKTEGQRVTAAVKVTNLVGHRLPSGVGFRRAFLEVVAVDKTNGKVVWGSGRTNGVGLILGANGEPLPSEFYQEYKVGKETKQHYQPHYEKITSQDQVQIYEELVEDSKGRITTSFIHRDEEIKDNRLLPKGWTPKGPSPNIPAPYVEATFPRANALKDPDYSNGSGSDSLIYEIELPAGIDPNNVVVRATLYYQAIPPPFLNMRFTGAPNGPATKRLFYLTSNLNVTRTPIADWKLKIASATR